MAKVAFLREDTVKDANALRLRLNQLITQVNEPNPTHKVVRLKSVSPGQEITIAPPGFPVGAVVLGGVRRVDGGTMPTTAAPWVLWSLQGNGAVSVTVNGISTTNPPLPPLYEIILVVMEAEATT